MASQSADHRGCNVTRFGGEKHSRGVFDHSFQAMYISRGETTTPKDKQKYIPIVNYNTKKATGVSETLLTQFLAQEKYVNNYKGTLGDVYFHGRVGSR